MTTEPMDPVTKGWLLVIGLAAFVVACALLVAASVVF